MNPNVRRWLFAGSALFALVGAIVTVVYLFQPWRSCNYEDTSAGCAMLPADTAVMAVAVVVTLVAVAAFALALLAKQPSAVR